MPSRVDEFGNAFAGSQLQIQTYVNRRRVELDAAICAAFPELQLRGASIEWVSPIEQDRFAEYQDSEFLSRLGLTELGGELASFWPQGGPRWDALAKIQFRDEMACGVLLLEAKSYPGEMIGNGCLATEPSLTRISASIEKARLWVGAEGGDWMGQYYQFGNRLAHLYFLREVCGIPTWLINICFFDDPHKPTRELVWRDALEYPMKALGLVHREIPFCKSVFLRAVEQGPVNPRHSDAKRPAGQPSRGAGKEWRFLRNDRTGRHQFLGFANARGSCSLRCFDAQSGHRLGEPRYGRGRDYQDAFASELNAGIPVDGPACVSVECLPAAILKRMRLDVGLDGAIEEAVMDTGSLLSGVDAFLDEILGVQHIGATSPHYKHRGSYQYLARSGGVDGVFLIRGMYDRIERNWPGTPCRGDQNWRLIPQLYIDPRNDSAEKRLEKAIAGQCAGWVNMVPVCSGVMPSLNEGGRRIDLVRRRAADSWEFVELKIGDNCDTPLYAALEILGYGLVYLFSRRHAERLGYSRRNPLLAARDVSLVVLAPAEAYRHGSLLFFERQMNHGMRKLVNADDGVKIDFRFECFPANHAWDPRESPQAFVDSRQKAYAD